MTFKILKIIEHTISLYLEFTLTYLLLVFTYFPFLIRLRPNKESKTGSKFSSMFSNNTVFPDVILFSNSSIDPFCPRRSTTKLSPYFCLIHLTPCN